MQMILFCKKNAEESARKLILYIRNMVLLVNENKKKLMVMIRNTTMNGTLCTKVFTFEWV